MFDASIRPLRGSALAAHILAGAALRVPAVPAAQARAPLGAGEPAPTREHRAFDGGGEREATGPMARCMARMLDEVDYGMLLVEHDGRVLYMNHAARRELDRDHPLQVQGRQLATALAAEAPALQEALSAAQRGLYRLLTLGRGEQRVGVSVVPLNEPGQPAGPTLLMLGKRRVCEQLSVQGYARAVALTPAETRVLELLCGGVQPTVIATMQGVAVSTVRTQIGSIRAKTGANSIRELVRQVAVLPPLVGALRSSASAFGFSPVALAA
jgi:DNA-binding CsgD family transcriptional regulator